MSGQSLQLIKLQFHAPVHLGEVGVGMERVRQYHCPSDTLWAALISARTRLRGDPSPWTPPSTQNVNSWQPPFSLSSAFPYHQDTYFFPKPLSPIPLTEEVRHSLTPTDWKNLKKTPFVVLPVFQKWVAGTPLTREDLSQMVQTWAEAKKKIQDFQEAHVRLGHAAFTSQIFYQRSVVFGMDAGLFFLVQFPDSDVKSEFTEALNLLAEEGLGGLRSRGFGTFSWTVESITFPEVNTPSHWLLLSMLIPESTLLPHLSRAYYALHQHKGWAMSPVTKDQGFRRPVWMIKEGAVFPQKPMGKVVDVTPENWTAPHPVLRYGLAFTLPYSYPNGGHSP